MLSIVFKVDYFSVTLSWECEVFSNGLPRAITLPVVILWVTSHAQ